MIKISRDSFKFVRGLVGIYAIVYVKDGLRKFYIGQSKNIGYRWSMHVWEMNKGRHHNRHLMRTWKKHGEDKFSFYIIELLDNDRCLLADREDFWINQFQSKNRNFGFNKIKGNVRMEKDFYENIVEASAVARRLGALNAADYWKKYKLDEKLPHSPDVYYPEWTNWNDFLGTNFYSYSEAEIAARKLGIKSKCDYLVRSKLDDKLPSNPPNHYGHEWATWGRFLGTNSLAPRDMTFLPFKEAREFARSLKLRDQKAWQRIMRPDGIPSQPNHTYADCGWKGWRDWLGGTAPKKPKPYCLDYDVAASVARSLGIRTCMEYERRYKEDSRLPASPRKAYPAHWDGWKSFLKNDLA